MIEPVASKTCAPTQNPAIGIGTHMTSVPSASRMSTTSAAAAAPCRPVLPHPPAIASRTYIGVELGEPVARPGRGTGHPGCRLGAGEGILGEAFAEPGEEAQDDHE